MPPLSLPLEKSAFIRVPFGILARMYHHAVMILACKKENIISDPGKGDKLPRYVANESVNAPSSVVCKKHSVRHGVYYVCSATCIDFNAYDICAHTIAVAEMDSSLTGFIQCYKATNQRPPNIDALIHMDLPAGRGTEKTKSTQRRRGAANSSRRRKDVVESYARTSSTGPLASTSEILPGSARALGNAGTEKEAETTTTTTGTRISRNTKGPQVHIYCTGNINSLSMLV